jgi:hypothetical protein
MKPTDPKHPWSRLTATARLASDNRETAAPYGFATRIAALAFTPERASSLFERFSLRALGVACLLVLVSAAANYSVIASALSEQDALLNDDPVAELVELAI